MKILTPFPVRFILSAGAALALAACGGGGADPVPGPAPITQQPAGVAATYVGPISGFGSVIVNGMRFDTVGATMADDDGRPVRLQDLSLGMTVSVDGTADDATARGAAKSLALLRGTTGPITALDAVSQTLTVLGMTVKATPATAYKDVAGFASLTVGSVVEVYGVVQSDNTVLATLIDKEDSASTHRLVGRLSGLNTVAKTFQVGSLQVSYGSATLAGVLVDGALVNVKAAQAPAGGVLTASEVRVGGSKGYSTTVAAGSYLKIKGVAEAAPVNGVLTVSGTRVNVAQAVYKNAGTIRPGDFLEIKGAWDGSVLLASKVELENDDRDNDGYKDSNELYGAVSALTAEGYVVMNGVTVDISSAYFDKGTRAQLAVGVPLEVKGVVQGNLFKAYKVEFKSGYSSNGSSSSSSSSSSTGFEYESYGFVSDFVSVSSFKVNGMAVDASAARFEDGTPANLANGAYLEVKGAQNAQGVFVARKIEFKRYR
ncbi:MAG: DUF5666 domain-containing protein [Burkholderiaceae bacterium]|nr:DUF5666 domain-containing protein [Burkholderiaceae bacterium]